MSSFWEEIGEKLKDLLGGWTAFVGLGSFLLYLLGYLSTRYYLTVLGVGTDLAVLDERYFFAGAKFLVYLVSTVPVLVLLALPPAIIVAIIRTVKAKDGKKTQQDKGRLKRWFSSPTVSASTGILVSTLITQIVLRQCFYFSNVLLAESLYETELGLEKLLLTDDETLYFFFTALVGGTILTGSIWLYARSRETQTTISKCANALLAFLIIVQFLFLPVNYGVYIQDRERPRVADLGDQVPLKAGQKAWLVWEGTNTFTYLVQENLPSGVSPGASNTETQAAPPVTASSPAAAGTQTPASTPAAAASPVSASTPVPVSVGTAAASSTPTGTQTPTVPSLATATPGPLGRKLVSVQQKDIKLITILEYDQIIKLIFCR